MANFENTFFEYFNAILRYVRAQPLHLGGAPNYSGGSGGPPGGFSGYLPQTKVAYDISEAESLFTPVNYSGASLVDNLNHIRYRINALEEEVINPGIDIENQGVAVGRATVLNMEEGLQGALDETEGQINLRVTLTSVSKTVPSGIYGENLTPQIAASGVHFTVANQFMDSSLRVFYNGVRQSPANYTLDGNYLGFTTDFTVFSGDTLVVDYDTPVLDTLYAISGVTQSYLTDNYYTKTATDTLLNAKANTSHTHTEAQITDLEHDAVALRGIAISSTPPGDSQALLYNIGSNQYVPGDVASSAKTIYQQYLFTIEGTMADAETGVKPIRIYAHDVNGTATIDEVFLSLDTAPLVSDVRVNVTLNESTIFSAPAYAEVLIGDNTGMRDSSLAITTFTQDDFFKIELVQADTTASDLTVHIRFHWETD